MKKTTTPTRPLLTLVRPPRVMIIEARFYEDVLDHLAAGARAVLLAHGAMVETVVVPGALEIPGAIAMIQNARGGRVDGPDGYVALGCVIRGATTHYDTVCTESARGIMDLTVREGLAIGNGILTCENKAQADERAKPDQMDKGGDAAYAALMMIQLRQNLQHSVIPATAGV